MGDLTADTKHRGMFANGFETEGWKPELDECKKGGKIERTAIRVRLERMKLRGLKTSADEEMMMRLDGKMRTNWANLRKPKQNRSEGEEKIRWRWNLCANSNSNLHASSPSPLVSRIQSNEVRNVTTAANDKSDLWKFDAEKEKNSTSWKIHNTFLYSYWS